MIVRTALCQDPEVTVGKHAARHSGARYCSLETSWSWPAGAGGCGTLPADLNLSSEHPLRARLHDEHEICLLDSGV